MTEATEAAPTSPQIRVLIADDHPLIAVGLTTALQRQGITVIDPVLVAEEVVGRYEETNPDVLVLDIRFNEGLTGLEVARDLLQRHPNARIVFYSQFDQDETIVEAYRIGGAAFIPKSTAPALLAEAIKHVHTGQVYFLRAISERIALLSLRGHEAPQLKLDPRELEVFKYMAQGLINSEIGEQMDLSPKTISSISQSVKDKLGIERQAELTLLAVKHHIIFP